AGISDIADTGEGADAGAGIGCEAGDEAAGMLLGRRAVAEILGELALEAGADTPFAVAAARIAGGEEIGAVEFLDAGLDHRAGARAGEREAIIDDARGRGEVGAER